MLHTVDPAETMSILGTFTYFINCGEIKKIIGKSHMLIWSENSLGVNLLLNNYEAIPCIVIRPVIHSRLACGSYHQIIEANTMIVLYFAFIVNVIKIF